MPELRVEEDTLAAELGMDSDEEFDTGRRTVDAYMKVKNEYRIVPNLSPPP